MKKFFRIVLGRLLYMLLFISLQIGALAVMFLYFRNQFAYYYVVCILISIAAGLYVLNDESNPAYKIAWLVPILLLPIFGGLLYLMFGRNRLSRKEKQRTAAIAQRYYAAAHAAPADDLKHLETENLQAALHARYIRNAAGMPPFAHTQTQYYPSGEALLTAMLSALESAQKFIFLEYFIIEEGEMWSAISDVLERKAAQGVDVRVMYDDMGCLFTLPRGYAKVLERRGIRAAVFNPFNTVLNARFNNRDHRKICVVDGNIGFTGGVNLADEYINRVPKHGHWKDTGIRLVGAGVWSFTVMFLSLWDFIRGDNEYFALFAPSAEAAMTQAEGYVQPFTDMPLDDEAVGETVYRNLLNRASRYVYITTPYLIVGSEMLTAMQAAAKSGVDVRIITPGVPDKKIVYALTRSCYAALRKAGVRIYEYTPGFIHAKTFVSDDAYAVVGTINLDFRSLYLHYECAAWMYRSAAVAQVREDFDATLSQCAEVTDDTLKRQPLLARLGLALLRVFAPLF